MGNTESGIFEVALLKRVEAKVSQAFESISSPGRKEQHPGVTTVRDLWSSVDDLLDRCIAESSVDALVAHGVGLLAANRLYTSERPVPPLLQSEQSVATMVHLAGRSLLQRIRSILEGPVVLIKGPEVAANYARPTLRAYGDLDILVQDSAHAKEMLLAAGFEEVDDVEFDHTERPLRWPGYPLLIELHHDLPWLRWMSTPCASEYLQNAIPSATGVEGIDTLPLVDHALLVAAHAWRHVPLRRLSDLIDVAAMIEGTDRSQLQVRADELGMGRVWTTTLAASDALLDDDPTRILALRLWARHLYPPRDRSVVEAHIARWLGIFAAPTFGGRLHNLRVTAREDWGPLPGESWPTKLTRTGRAVVNAGAPTLLRKRDSTNPLP